MTGISWKWPGARWWKCDLHVHSPGSGDYPEKETSAEEWVEAAVGAGVQVVGVTDHNTADWVERLQGAATDELAVFPGVELTVAGGDHVLVIFERRTTKAEIDRYLGNCNLRSRGQDEPADCTYLQAMENASSDAVVIAAHITSAKGIFKSLGFGKPLQHVLTSPHLDAVEIHNQPDPDEVDEVEDRKKLLSALRGEIPDYRRTRGPLAVLTHSDAHRPSKIGSRTTWIKMSEPTLEGLRLALQDGQPLSVLSEWDAQDDPNGHGDLLIERIEVENLRYMGRGRPFVVDFNPWFNAVIGGRGTGKSTLVECLRLCLRRKDELPEALEEEMAHFYRAYQDRDGRGLLTPESQIQVIYRKDGGRFRIRWRADGEGEVIEEEVEPGEWRSSPGLVKERFKVRIYSQKQIFELARNPAALLRIVDEAPDVDHADWLGRWNDLLNRFLTLRSRAREVAARLDRESALKGELDDLNRKLDVFEKQGHAGVLRTYHRRRRQERAVERWLQSLQQQEEKIRRVSEEIGIEPPDPTSWDQVGDETEAHQLLIEGSEAVQDVRSKLLDLSAELAEVRRRTRSRLDESSWRSAVSEAGSRYQELIDQLHQQGVADPDEYARLVQRRQLVEEEIRSLGAVWEERNQLEKQAEDALARLLELRREITRKRRAFLGQVLPYDSQHVRAELRPFGDRSTAVEDLRMLLDRSGTTFEKDIGTAAGDEGILGRLYRASDPACGPGEWDREIEGRLDTEKKRLLRVAEGEGDPEIRDGRFSSHVQSLQPEQVDRLLTWFPQDSLEISYSPSGDGRGFKPLQEASPGQKTAALLTFLLAYGEEPIILDQPEDDLDNHLIYDLLVQRFRELKRRRQLIVVTHNPNIVVHGDAELVVSLDQRAGCTWRIAAGALQERSVREEVCRVMEGGEEALRRRYQRIAEIFESSPGKV